MRRLALLVLLLSACPKKEEPAPELAPSGPPARGMSVTKVKDPGAEGSGSEGGSGAADGSADGGSAGAQGPTDAGVADASLSGGNGKPAYRGDDGRVRGPGGPVFMGRGYDCTDQVDHCLRDGVWFGLDNLVSGKMYRATPIFEFEGKWYNWRSKEEAYAKRLKTKVGTAKTLRVGEPVVWLIDENASKKWVNNEYDALTTSRWVAGYVESIEGDKIRVKGWTYGTVPIDTTRIIVEQK